MSEIEKILVLPILDIKEPIEISSENAVDVIANMHVILRKCLYCIRQELPVPLEVFLFVLAQAAFLNPGHFCNVMPHVTEEGSCIDLFTEVFRQLLSRERSSLRLGFNIEMLFEVAHVLCNDTKLKSKLGGNIGQTLLSFMMDTFQQADDYRVHRSCASALIALLRGSPTNKNRFKTECGKIAVSLERSSDFFFQMQCTEIIFRLYIHDGSVLEQGQINDYLRRGISSLHNDATLLLSIQNFLDGYNAEFNVSRILPFTIVRLEAAGTEVCSHTTIYFSPLLVVAMLPGGTGDSFSIPFEHIRSVKLSKDHKLGLRLNTIPLRLSQLMDVSDGRDTLHIFLTQTTLVSLRSCGVHEWISTRKRNAPRRYTVLQTKAEGLTKNTFIEALRDATTAVVEENSSEEMSRISSSMSERVPNSINVPDKVSRKPSQPLSKDKDQLDEIHSAAAIKTARFREQRLHHLQLASDELQSKIDTLQQLNGRDRNSFEASFREDMTTIRRAETSLKECATECVQSLNAELEDMQALGTALKGEIDKLRERLAKSFGKSEGVEEACLLRIKRLVDSRIEMIEMKVFSLSTESTPLSRVLNSLRQHLCGDMSAAVSTDKQPTSLRLEYL